LNYVEIGNEDFADSSGSYASYRWKDFVTTLSTTFPQLNFIATTYVNDPVLSPKTKFWDVHDYNTPSWFFQNAFRFDSFARDGTKYFEGEYAVINTNASNLFGSGPTRLSYPQMQGTAGEAAYMTGMERNADIVFAASYAPMLQSVNNFQWTPNLISFDAGNVYLSTSYYVQKMFSLAKGTLYLPSTLPSSTGSVHWSVTRSSSSGGQVFIKASSLPFAQQKKSLPVSPNETRHSDRQRWELCRYHQYHPAVRRRQLWLRPNPFWRHGGEQHAHRPADGRPEDPELHCEPKLLV